MIILAHQTDLPSLGHVLKCDAYALSLCNAFAQVSRARACGNNVTVLLRAGRLAGTLRQEEAKLGRSASISRASFVFFFLFQQPLEMCDAYCEQ